MSAEEGEDHMRPVSGTRGNLRGSALWGKPKGESRSSALWGKPGRGFAILALVAALAAPVAATAGESGRSVQAARALVPASLMADAEAHPTKVFYVIVQGSRGTKSSTVAGAGRELREVEARQGEGPEEELHERERRLRRAHGRTDRRPGQAAGDPRDHARHPDPSLRPVHERPDLGRLGRASATSSPGTRSRR